MRAYPAYIYPAYFIAVFCLCNIFIFSSNIFAQPAQGSGTVRLSDWQTYSALTNIRAVAQDARGTLWAATSGGVFAYNFTSKQLQTFRNIDALIGLDITAIGIAPTGEVYAGGINGIINVYDGVKWSPVTDIFTSSIARKRVTSIVFRDSLAFIGGEFGLVIYNTRQKVFFETIARIGTLSTNVPVRRLLIAQGRIWVGSDEGLASASVNLSSFVNPTVWRNHRLEGVSDAAIITGLAATSSGIVVGAGNALWSSTTANVAVPLLRGGLSGAVSDVAVTGTNVFAGLDGQSGSRIIRADATTPTLFDLEGAFANALAVVDSLGLQTLAAASTNGLFLAAGGTTRKLTINSPTANRFREIAVDAQGAVWGVNGTSRANPNVNNDGPGAGLYRLAGGQWTNFLAASFPQMQSNNYYQIYGAPDSSVWASAWGDGLVRLQPSVGSGSTQPSASFTITRYDTTNSRLRGIGNYIAAGAVRTDTRTGTVWMSNFTSDSITAQDRQGRFYAFAKPATLRTCEYANYNLLTIDGAGTKWVGKGSEATLWAFNDKNTLSDPSDDQWRCLSSGLGSSSCTALVTDNNGEVWVGTKQGLYRIVTPYYIFGGGDMIISTVQIETLGRLTINAISVDAQNNKWLATNSGVWVVSADGGDLLAQFNTDTSPLVNNNVLSLAIDNNTGRAYFGTENGLSSAQTLAVKPNADFSGLRCYPQPFVPSEDTELVIDGLADNAQVKITTLDGTLVKTINVTSSRVAVWDGRDMSNQVVNSGVYIVSAFSSAGGGITGAVKAVVLQQR